MFLNNQHVTEEIKREINKFLETNDNENMTNQNLRDAAKAVLRGSLQQYNPTSRNKENIEQNLTLHLKQPEKEEQQQKKKPKIGRRKEIIKIRAEISERNNSKDLKN